jgi:RHS repeat-associated protein
LISRTTRNLSGTSSTTESPDLTAIDAQGNGLIDDLIVTSSTTTSYLNPQGPNIPPNLGSGIGRRTVTTTADNFSQTTDSFFDGKTAKTYGDLSPAMQYAYSVNAIGEVTGKSYVDGTNLRETTSTQSDWAGRTLRMDYMDGTFATMEYNSKGQMEKSTDPDGVISLMAYNTEGEQTINAVDLNANGVIDYGSDTVQFTETVPALRGSTPVLRTTSKVWYTQGATVFDPIVSQSDSAANGLQSWSWQIGQGASTPDHPNSVFSTSVTTLGGNGAWTTTSTAPDGTKTVGTYTAGKMVSMAKLNTDEPATEDSVIEFRTQGYDSLNRPTTSTHSRTGTSTTTYFSDVADSVVRVTDAGGRFTKFFYDIRGRRISVDAPDTPVDESNPTGPKYDNITTTTYNPDSTVTETNGDQTYRVSHTYDYADRQISMTTYGTTTATTTWQYSSTRGFLLAKRDAANKGATYTYKASGRLKTRTWARGKHTRYDYDLGGRLTNTHYFTAASEDNGSNVGNDAATPSISMAYDAINRPTSQSNGLATSTFNYNSSNLQIDTETIAYNLDGQPGADFTRVIDRSQDSLGRESGWQLKNGTTPENEVAYNYGSTDGRLASVNRGASAFSYGYTPGSSLIASVTSPAHTVSNVYELDRDVLASKVNKKLDTTTVSSYFYTVNSYGQRTGVNKDGTAFASTRTIAWGYNSKGEVVKADSSEAGFDRAYQYDGIGNRLKSADSLTLPSTNNYTPNALNQYAAINASNPTYDDDGNATAYPLPANLTANSVLVWDGENRLIEAEVNSGNTVNYVYDSQSRRIAETVGSNTIVYVYDGWNPIAEYSTAFALTKTYTWGLDLSGSMQGAGGVGGLLSATDGTGTYFPTFDGNGNVSEYLDSNGAIAAHYEYDPFGKTTVSNGSKVNDFAHRFSTKPLDLATGLYYYGYRFYDPETGRWPSRDPIEEKGGVNLYLFVSNRVFDLIDILGLCPPRAIVVDLAELQEMCIKSLEDANKNLTIISLKRRIDELIAAGASNCKQPKIACFCCEENEDDDLNNNRGGDFNPITFDIRLCSNGGASSVEAVISTLLHELIHAEDKCLGYDFNDCQDRACSEVRAYSTQLELTKEQVRELAKKSTLADPNCKDNIDAIIDVAMENCYGDPFGP